MIHPHRLLLDANIWISTLLSPGGRCANLVRGAFQQGHRFIISPRLVHEIGAGLSKPFCLEQYGITPPRLQQYIEWITENSLLVQPEEVMVQIRDPMDLHVISAALAGKATHLITGDRDFLDDHNLKQWLGERGVGVMTAREYYEENMIKS